MYLQQHNLKGSTCKKYVQAIICALRWGSRFNLTLSPTYDCYEKNVCKYESTKVVLSPDDVSWIAHFDIDTIEKRSQWREVAKRVRDQFILSVI